MLSVTGANFTPDNGSVFYTALAVPVQTRTGGPSCPCSAPSCTALADGDSAAREHTLCAGKFLSGRSLCRHFSRVKNALRACNCSQSGLGVFHEECSAFCRACVCVGGLGGIQVPFLVDLPRAAGCSGHGPWGRR